MLGTGEINIVGGHAPFYVKHKALANLNSVYVSFPVEIHLQLFTTIIITTVLCTGAIAPIASVLPPPMNVCRYNT